MSRENVELVRQVYEFWNETHDIDSMLGRFFTEDVSWVEPPDSPNAGVFAGREAVAGYLRDWVEHMDLPTYEVQDLIDAGDRVVAMLQADARGAASELRLGDVPLVHVCELRDGKVAAVSVFYKRRQALQAAGLRD